MPNWCSNTINLVGPRDKIRAVWQEAQKEKSGLLNALIPMPEGLDITAGRVGADDEPEQIELARREAENLERYGARNWYDWSVANWGTKWDVSLEGLEYEEDEDGNYDNGGKGPHARISGWFDSAWAPPCAAMEAYANDNEDVTITLDYYESGMGFVGRAHYQDGEMQYDDYYDIGGYTSENVRDLIGDDIDDHWNISENMAEWEADNEEEADELEEFLEEGAKAKGLVPPDPIKF